MFRAGLTVLVASLCLASASCSGGSQTTIASGDNLPEDQWSRGVWLYGQHCAGCHGEDGEGDEDAPPLSGEGSLPLKATWEGSPRTHDFNTAADVFTYVSEQMPPMEPGTLKSEDYWAIVFYSLKQAQVEVGEPPMNANSARNVALR